MCVNSISSCLIAASPTIAGVAVQASIEDPRIGQIALGAGLTGSSLVCAYRTFKNENHSTLACQLTKLAGTMGLGLIGVLTIFDGVLSLKEGEYQYTKLDLASKLPEGTNLYVENGIGYVSMSDDMDAKATIEAIAKMLRNKL